MTSAAFKATYSDWKPVKSRRVIQVVFEVPWEKHDEAYQALGGMCDPGKERWFGIARLTEGKEGEVTESQSWTTTDTPPRLDSNASAGAERGHKSPAQIAGYLCTLPAFLKFLKDKFPKQLRDAEKWGPWDETPTDGELAAACVRLLCNVDSRADIKSNNTEWLSLMLAWKLWNKEAEVVPA